MNDFEEISNLYDKPLWGKNSNLKSISTREKCAV